MNNDDLIQEPVAVEAAPAAKPSRMGWRLVVVIVALLVIGILAYPSLQKWWGGAAATPAEAPTALPTTISGPATAVQANPNSAQAQFDLANAYVKAGQWEQALTAYQKVIELDPNFQGAYANMGVVYYQLQQLDLAATQYQKALELNPNDGDVAYNLGALYLQQALSGGASPNPDLLAQAINQLKHATELKPQLAEPFFALGVAYASLNQPTEAIEAFETFLARDSGQDSRASQEAERYLKALRQQQ